MSATGPSPISHAEAAAAEHGARGGDHQHGEQQQRGEQADRGLHLLGGLCQLGRVAGDERVLGEAGDDAQGDALVAGDEDTVPGQARQQVPALAGRSRNASPT